MKAHVYVVEFQKQGLPHAHILTIFEDEFKLNNTDDFDQIISAEIPNPELHPQLYATVSRTMTHEPCGILNLDAPFMIKDGCHKKCSKKFPKNFTEENEDGYPVYKRTENGRKMSNAKTKLLNSLIDGLYPTTLIYPPNIIVILM